MSTRVYKVFLFAAAEMLEYRRAAMSICGEFRGTVREPGIGEDIAAAVEDADFVVIILGASVSEYVEREYALAVNLRKPVFVFLKKTAPEPAPHWMAHPVSYFENLTEFDDRLRAAFAEWMSDPAVSLREIDIPKTAAPAAAPPTEFKFEQIAKPSPYGFDVGQEITATVSAPQAAAPQKSGWLRWFGKVSRAIPEYTVVKVFYATDRKKGDASVPGRFYANERAANRHLTFGTCDVSIPGPDYHKVGRLEAPSIFTLDVRANPGKHVLLLGVKTQEAGVFFRNLARDVAKSERKAAFVFIHGYNVSFEDAARRTAQLAADLKFDGAPIFYSWPSKAAWWSYSADETNVMWCVPQLEAFLGEVANRVGATTIHLIAHSMGNRALTAALQLIAAKKSIPQGLFHHIILTAPDIDEETFQSLAMAIASGAERLTMYSNYRDRALLLSMLFHFYRRAGASIVIVPGMDTIDASKVDTSLVHHSYFASSRTVLADVSSLIVDGKPPSKRFGMSEKRKAGKTYYIFRP